MTRLMEQAVVRLRAVPPSQQDRLAQFLLAQLDDDARRARATADNEAKLKDLVNGVLADDASGKCEALDPDRL